MSITVRPGDNTFWGPHVFLEGSGDAEGIREDYARRSAGWPPPHFAIAEATPEAFGAALTTHALAYAAEQGYRRMRTNWRVTNLGASRFWPSRGFRLTRLRLVRRLPDL